jgi:hypothetical protein
MDEIRELAKLGRLRNRLLSALTLRSRLRRAAERVMRLSEAGTPERFFTLVTVAEQSGLSTTAIVDEIVNLNAKESELNANNASNVPKLRD